jgi:hypothetical protein
MRSHDVGPFEMRSAEEGRLEMRSPEGGLFEMRYREGGRFKMRVREVGPFEMRSPEIGVRLPHGSLCGHDGVCPSPINRRIRARAQILMERSWGFLSERET